MSAREKSPSRKSRSARRASRTGKYLSSSLRALDRGRVGGYREHLQELRMRGADDGKRRRRQVGRLEEEPARGRGAALDRRRQELRLRELLGRVPVDGVREVPAGEAL